MLNDFAGNPSEDRLLFGWWSYHLEEVIESRFPRMILNSHHPTTVTKVSEIFGLHQKDLGEVRKLLLLFTNRSGQIVDLDEDEDEDEDEDDKDDKDRGGEAEVEQPLLTELMSAPLAKRMQVAVALGFNNNGRARQEDFDY